MREETRSRMEGQGRVFLVQDTTSFNYSGHAAVEGLGTLENKGSRGFFVHSTLAVSEAGLPLGVVAQQVWVRPVEELGKRSTRHERAFADKESYKWVDGVQERASGRVWAQGVTVCDREAPIYEFLDTTLQAQLDFIVRGASGRSFTLDGVEVFEAITFQLIASVLTIALNRRPEHAARQATLHLRFGSLTLKRPQRADSTRDTLTVQVVEVNEPDPPAGEEAVHWLLLTSLPVETVQHAQQIVTFYTYRWLIERFHFTLKSGCKREESQLRQEKRLERLLAVYSGVAWSLLWLTYLARLTPNAPCPTALTVPQWQALFTFIHRSSRLPVTVPSLHQAARWIAQLGGFLGRKADGDPGVKVLWRGWTRLHDIADTWLISHPPPKDVGNV